MADITVRDLDDQVQQHLKRRAAEHGRAMEAEARAILTAALNRGGLARSRVEAASDLCGDDIPFPVRPLPRPLDVG